MLPKWCAEPSPPAAGQRREPPAGRERAGSPGRAGAAVGGGAAAVSPRSPRVNRASSSGSGTGEPRHQFVTALSVLFAPVNLLPMLTVDMENKENGSLDVKNSVENGRPPDPADWAVIDVVNYFRTAGFEEQASAFQEQVLDLLHLDPSKAVLTP
uniref:Sterile alpha motif domain containing 13 n=1 Tax=Anser brachyrhynchus TaxID=132585 RepID=A0A8B9CPK0_9AVES